MNIEGEFLKKMLTTHIFSCYNKASNERGFNNEQSNDFRLNPYGMGYYRYD